MRGKPGRNELESEALAIASGRRLFDQVTLIDARENKDGTVSLFIDGKAAPSVEIAFDLDQDRRWVPTVNDLRGKPEAA